MSQLQPSKVSVLKSQQTAPLTHDTSRLIALSTLRFLHDEIINQLKRVIQTQLQQQGKEAVALLNQRLEALGVDVGVRLCHRLTQTSVILLPSASQPLDCVKFLCKEIWSHLFTVKQIEKLQTNYKGTYVLHDYSVVQLQHIEITDKSTQSQDVLYHYVAMTVGIITGVLKALGLKECSVRSDIVQLGQHVTYTIQDHAQIRSLQQQEHLQQQQQQAQQQEQLQQQSNET